MGVAAFTPRRTLPRGRARLATLESSDCLEERCSSVLLIVPAAWWSWLKKKPRCSTTTTSAPSTSCSGSSTRAKAFAAKALESLDISLDAVREQVQDIIGQGQQQPTGHIPFTPRAKKVLELSLREALQLGHNYIGTEHILLGLIREGEGVAAQVLVKLGADLSTRFASRSSSCCQRLPGQAEQVQVGAQETRQRQGRLAGARPVRSQPHAGRARQQARPGHRAREGDRAGHADPVAPLQEQPRAHR